MGPDGRRAEVPSSAQLGSARWTIEAGQPGRKPARVCVARSRVRPMVRLYIAHVGGRPTWSDCSRPSLRIGRWVAPWLLRMAPGRQLHAHVAWAVCVGSDLHMVRMYIAHVGVDPPGVTAAGRRCGLDGGLHRGSIAWYPGPNPPRKPHEPCVCSPLSGPTYGALVVHSPRGGRPTWSDCSRAGVHRGADAVLC